MKRPHTDNRPDQLEQALKNSPSHSLSDAQLKQMLDSTLDRVDEYPDRLIQSSAHSEAGTESLRYVAAAILIIAGLLSVGYWLNQRSGKETSHDRPFAVGSVINSPLLDNAYARVITFPEKSILSEFQKLSRDAHHASAFLVNCMPAVPAEASPDAIK